MKVLMEYEGKLYGRVGSEYYPLIETTDDFEGLKKDNSELIDFIRSINDALTSMSPKRRDSNSDQKDIDFLCDECAKTIQKHQDDEKDFDEL